MKISDLALHCFELTSFPENCYVVARKGRDDCVVVDPGLEPSSVVAFIKENALRPSAILVTHGHFDHIAGIVEIESAWSQTPIYIGENDKSKLVDPNGNLSSCFGLPCVINEPSHGVHDDETINAAGLVFKTSDAPGHSCGHVVYLLECDERTIVFCGDVIFADSVGRTDFPDGNQAVLIQSIHDKLLSLPNETILCPGHGPTTTVIQEKRNNPFLRLR